MLNINGKMMNSTDYSNYVRSFKPGEYARLHRQVQLERLKNKPPEALSDQDRILVKLSELDDQRQQYAKLIAQADKTLDTPKNSVVSYHQNLDNCTDAVQSASEEGTSMYKREKVLLGYDPSGKPIEKFISGKTRDELQIKAATELAKSGRLWEVLPSSYVMQHLPAMQPSIVKPKTSTPFKAYVLEWYKRYKSDLRQTTDVTQRGWRDQLCKFFNDEPIESITVARVQDYINSIQQNTTGAIGQKVVFLSEIFASAREDGLIEKDPTQSKRINLGGQESKGIVALPKEKVRELIDKIASADDKLIKFYLALMLYTGLRREEMLGLRWEDIDLDAGFLHISRAVTYPSSKPVVGKPKTKKSKRDVAMPDELVSLLTKYKQPNGYLVSDENGELFNDYNIKKLREAAREYAELPELDARQLRHSYASMLDAAGIGLNTIGVSMGHTNVKTTKRYIDVEKDRLNDIRNAGIDYVLS